MNAQATTWRAYVQLLRLPNVFTAVADVTMGYLFVNGSLLPGQVFACLTVASVSLYLAGMVWNDICDLEQDARERPERPLPSGRMALAQARRLGLALLGTGLICAWGAGYLPGALVGIPWRAGLVGTLLVVLIVSYDAVLKRTWLGPLAMGGCRALNVLLGMAAAAVIAAETRVLGFSDAQLLVAGGLGLYVAGVTWFARTEARVSSRLALVCATLVMGGGIAVLGLVYRRLPPEVPVTLRQESTWLLLLGLLAFTIMRRCAIAVVEPEPRRVQLAVQHAIWSLIMLDAALVLLVCHPSWAVAIVLLLIPTIWLGRRVAST